MSALLSPPSRRLLGSRIVDLLLGPHGIDRYLELVDPRLALSETRAEVRAVRRQSARSVTLTLEPNGAWQGFHAGQFVPVGVEIDGVRRTRTYSPACSERRGARELELTVTTHPHGLVSRHLNDHAAPGMIVHLGSAAGEFVLPRPRPRRLALISGGSGITPVLSMLRTLCEEGHDGEIVFLHFARTRADWLYEREVRALADSHPGLEVSYVATREGGRRLSEGSPAAQSLAARFGAADLEEARVAVCGPPVLVGAVRRICASAPARILCESFAPPVPPAAPGTGAVRRTSQARGTVRFLRSGRSLPAGAGSLLEQAEAAGLRPAFGCRMGICRTCTCRKAAGAVRNLRTGEISREEDEDIQICVSAAAGDVAIDL